MTSVTVVADRREYKHTFEELMFEGQVFVEQSFEKSLATNKRSCFANQTANGRSQLILEDKSLQAPEGNMSAGLMWQPASSMNKAAGAETYVMPSPAFQPEVSPRRLTLVPPYTAPRTAPQVYWKRRLVAVAALITLVVGAWSLVSMGASLVSSRTAAPATAATGLGSASPAAQSNSLTWTVRPGDTLWGIARSLKPSGDIRTVLDPLMKKYSGQPLQVGQTLTVTAK